LERRETGVERRAGTRFVGVGWERFLRFFDFFF
jgi:hypothetical protein